MDYRDDAAQITLDFPSSEPTASGAEAVTSRRSAPRRSSGRDGRSPVTLRSILRAAADRHPEGFEGAAPEVRDYLRSAPRVPANGVLAQAPAETQITAAPPEQAVAVKAVA